MEFSAVFLSFYRPTAEEMIGKIFSVELNNIHNFIGTLQRDSRYLESLA